MMRRLWAALAAAFSVAAVFTVLAFTQRPAPAAPAASAQIVMARAANGKLVPVPVAPSGSVHATTQTSPASAAAGQAGQSPAAQPVTYVKTSSGAFVPVSLGSTSVQQPTTRTS
jgi:hypothetical protein